MRNKNSYLGGMLLQGGCNLLGSQNQAARGMQDKVNGDIVRGKADCPQYKLRIFDVNKASKGYA
jgi:hypothetical protein